MSVLLVYGIAVATAPIMAMHVMMAPSRGERRWAIAVNVMWLSGLGTYLVYR